MASSSHVGGVLSGVNPFVYSSTSPYTLFLFQTCLILIMCNLVHIPFAKIHQPKVISEVIAGVILGPTVLGQIPNYTDTIFPSASIPGLNLVANIGIILFMFFLGLEVDTGFIRKHLKTALTIGLITLAVPFGFGCALAIPLFHTYANLDPNAKYVKFTVFMVFIAVSMCVTAFPVLCRILNELRLIKDRAGVVVLGAGIINDILGWILLALSVILSSSESSPVNTVYILLCTLGWFLLYFYPLKYVLKWFLVRYHELDRPKPSPLATMFILLIMFISAYFTDIIGVHPIFGAFIAGLIVPRENNYVVKLAERMEDIPNIVFIPIYFAVSGLSVDLTLLNQGKDWAYVFASIGVAVGSKVSSGTITAYAYGLFFRESMAVGVLMSCKGIVEIVVLTIGLNAGIIEKKIYGMFILMALVSTFITTPLTQLVYPDSYRKNLKSRIIQKNMIKGKKDAQQDYDSESVPLSDIAEQEQSIYELQNFTKSSELFSFEDILTFRPNKYVTIINSTDTISPSLQFLNYMLFNKKPAYISNRSTLMNSSAAPISRMSSGSTLIKDKSVRLKKLLSNKLRKGNDQIEEHVLDIIDEDGLETPSNFDAVIPLKAIHLRLMTERTTDLLQSSTFYDSEYPNATFSNSDSYLEIFDIFTRMGKIPFTSEVIFSTMKEKAVNIVSSDIVESDIVILPIKGSGFNTSQYLTARPSAPMGGNSSLQYTPSVIFETFEQCYSHMMGLNELSSSFFENLSRNLKSNFILMVSNTGGKRCVDRFKKKRINLLLPNPNIASSDFFALYLFLNMCYKALISGDPVKPTIYVNGKNDEFLDKLYNLFPDHDWFADAAIDIISVDVAEKSINEVRDTSFIELVLNNSLSDYALGDLDNTTFIIPENIFSGAIPFSEEVKETIAQGASKKFDILIAHYHAVNRKLSSHLTPITEFSNNKDNIVINSYTTSMPDSIIEREMIK